MFQIIPLLAAGEPEAPGMAAQLISLLIPIGLLVLLMYFMMIRPQKKQRKEEQEMRDNIRVGDEIITIGGISGRVLIIRDEELVIESGTDRTKLTIKKWAISSNETIRDAKSEFDEFDDEFDDDFDYDIDEEFDEVSDKKDKKKSKKDKK